MKLSLIDTDILSLFFRSHSKVVERFSSYLISHKKINFSIITYYEIISGLKHRDANKQLYQFLDFTSKNEVIQLTQSSATISGEIYAELRKDGQPIDDVDLLIAGIAIENNMILVTRNANHFGRIKRLEIQDWTK